MNNWIQKNLIFPKINEYKRKQERQEIGEFIKESIITQLRQNHTSSLYHLHSSRREEIRSLLAHNKHPSQYYKHKVKRNLIQQHINSQTVPKSPKQLVNNLISVGDDRKVVLHPNQPCNQSPEQQLAQYQYDKLLSKHKSNIILKSNLRLKIFKARTEPIEARINKSIKKGEQFLTEALDIKQLGYDNSNQIIKISHTPNRQKKPYLLKNIAKSFKTPKKIFQKGLSIIGWKTESSDS